MSDLKNVKPLDDFNWDEFENGGKRKRQQRGPREGL